MKIVDGQTACQDENSLFPINERTSEMSALTRRFEYKENPDTNLSFDKAFPTAQFCSGSPDLSMDT